MRLAQRMRHLAHPCRGLVTWGQHPRHHPPPGATTPASHPRPPHCHCQSPRHCQPRPCPPWHHVPPPWGRHGAPCPVPGPHGTHHPCPCPGPHGTHSVRVLGAGPQHPWPRPAPGPPAVPCPPPPSPSPPPPPPPPPPPRCPLHHPGWGVHGTLGGEPCPSLGTARVGMGSAALPGAAG